MSDTLLSLFNQEQKRLLFAKSKVIKCTCGAQLFSLGESADHMYLVEKGKVSLFRLMPNGNEKLFKVLFSGEMIAEMAMFMSPRIYPMSARVEQDSVFYAFNYQDVANIVTSSQELSLKVMSLMSNNISSLMDSVDILTQVNANQRLVMRLAEIYRAQILKEGKILLPVTKRLLASQLGMTPETLSRAFKRLKDSGSIVESGNHVTLIDIPSLCNSVDLSQDIFTQS